MEAFLSEAGPRRLSSGVVYTWNYFYIQKFRIVQKYISVYSIAYKTFTYGIWKKVDRRGKVGQKRSRLYKSICTSVYKICVACKWIRSGVMLNDDGAYTGFVSKDISRPFIFFYHVLA